MQLRTQRHHNRFWLENREIGLRRPTYFIADIGANHDGSLSRARELIKLAAEAGADCVKFQHFQAGKIVSERGFGGLKIAHQATWDKPVYEVYEQYSLNRDWNDSLAAEAKQAGVHFMTTPYDIEAAEQISRLVLAYKIGSGEITHRKLITAIAAMEKPIFLATGASTLSEVIAAVELITMRNPELCLMQCNTNYTGDLDNFRHINLRVLETYSKLYPDLPLGLSDHTPGHATALGAVAMGACVIEKHFTDDISRPGPDHRFAMTKFDWLFMVQSIRQLEMAMGDGAKVVEPNEKESVVVQRRALRLKHDLVAGEMVLDSELEALRPCPEGAYTPAQIKDVDGRILKRDMVGGQAIYPDDLE